MLCVFYIVKIKKNGSNDPTETTTKINFVCRNYPRCPKKMQLQISVL